MLEQSQVQSCGRPIAHADTSTGETMHIASTLHPLPSQSSTRFGLLQPARHWLDSLEIRNVKTARRLARLIPAQCPFERDIKFMGHTVAHIPPLCKLNPFYDQFVTLRFRALCYLADECGEDIRSYC